MVSGIVGVGTREGEGAPHFPPPSKRLSVASIASSFRFVSRRTAFLFAHNFITLETVGTLVSAWFGAQEIT